MTNKSLTLATTGRHNRVLGYLSGRVIRMILPDVTLGSFFLVKADEKWTAGASGAICMVVSFVLRYVIGGITTSILA